MNTSKGKVATTISTPTANNINMHMSLSVLYVEDETMWPIYDYRVTGHTTENSTEMCRSWASEHNRNRIHETIYTWMHVMLQ